ncbi:MAG: trigger factor [Anaerolineaceae bacterium]
MKLQKEFTDDHQVKITAEFETELLEQYKHKAARKIAQRTRIPGFRPGKAPYSMVLTHVGEAAITEEAVELMLDKVYPDVLQEAAVKPYGPGNLDTIKSENPPVFEFTVPLEPEVELGDIDSLRKSYEPHQITDEDVQDFVTKTRRNAATIVPVETPAAEANLLYVTLEAENTNPEEGLDPILVKSSVQQILIPTETEEPGNEWPFKGFARLLIGHSAGEIVEIPHEFPVDSNEEEFRGKQALFKVNIQSVKALELPEMDEEFLKSMGDFETVEDLEKAARERLQTEGDASYDDSYYTGLVDQIRANATIKYPPQMLSEEEEQVLHRFEHELSHRQLDLDVYLKIRKTDREAFIQEEVKPTALNRLERSLVMEALSKKFDIKISNEDLEKEVATILNELIRSGELNDMQKELGEKKFANVISMEAANRVLENAIRRQLRTIACPESIVVSESEAPAEEKGKSVAEEVAPIEVNSEEEPAKADPEVS